MVERERSHQKRTRRKRRGRVPNDAASTPATRNLKILAARAAATTKRGLQQARTTRRTTAVNSTRPSSGKGATSAGNQTTGAAPDTGAAHHQVPTTTATPTPILGRPKVDEAVAVAEDPKAEEEAEGEEGRSVGDPSHQPLR